MSFAEQNSVSVVAELQGLFGPVSVPEQVVQKIWMRGDFRRDGLRTFSGEPLEIVSAGTWNRLDGPDFRGAEFIIGGVRVRGDVEIHFYAEDWFAHEHDKNPLYGNVVLHVLLFPPRGRKMPLANSRNEKMFTFLLLPHMKRDIEEYATDEALSAIEGRGDGGASVLGKLLEVPADERFRLLRNAAYTRWEQKKRFMEKRLGAAGNWENVCHQLALETLGLRRNREPMARLAARFSPSAMLLMDAKKLFDAEAGSWRLAGTRPANQPLARLAQYLELLLKNPAWPRLLRERLASLPATNVLGAGQGTKDFRAAAKMARVHEEISKGIFAGAIGGTRFETLIADAFLPLVSVAARRDLSAWWFHWFLGDAPGNVPKILREAEISTRSQPYCNGLFQGLIQISLE